MAFRFFPAQRTLSGGLKWETPPIIEWLSKKAGSKIVTSAVSYGIGASGIFMIDRNSQKGFNTSFTKDPMNMPYGNYGRRYAYSRGYRRRPYRGYRRYRYY